MIAGMPGGHLFFNVAFIVVMVSLLDPGLVDQPGRRGWLKLIVPPQIGPLAPHRARTAGRAATMRSSPIDVHPESPVAKGERIPRWARPSLILRDGRSLRPHAAGRVQPDDQVYIVTATNYVQLSTGCSPVPPRAARSTRQLYAASSCSIPLPGSRDVARTPTTPPIDPADVDLTLRDFLQAAPARQRRARRPRRPRPLRSHRAARWMRTTRCGKWGSGWSRRCRSCRRSVSRRSDRLAAPARRVVPQRRAAAKVVRGRRSGA